MSRSASRGRRRGGASIAQNWGFGVLAVACTAAAVWSFAGDAALAMAPDAGGPLAVLGPEAVGAVDPAAAVPTAVPTSTQRASALTNRASVPAPIPDPRIGPWVDDLRNDDIPGNGAAAIRRLLELPPGPVALLEAALGSGELQQRHLAAQVLRDRSQRDGDAPSPALARVCVEGLSHDVGVELRRLRLLDVTLANAHYLAQHAAPARAALRQGLWSGDEQQRFLCAYLLAQSGCTEDLGLVCRELVPRLADNDTGGDALMAAHGLYRLGEPALATLRAWRPAVDQQARSLIDLVEQNLLEPPTSRAVLAERGRALRVTSVYHDPSIEFDLSRSGVATWGPRR